MIGIPDIDKQVVIRAKEKDEEAIAEIINTIDKRSYTIVYNCLGANKKHVNEVEDIVQNAYIKAFSRIDLLKDNNFSPWFYTILEREVIDYSRTSYAQNKPFEFSQVENDEFNESYEDTIENTHKEFEPQASVDYSELKQGILDCLNQLPEMQRTALYLHYIEKRKISEISEMYDTKENTVKSWLKYGRKGMKNILEDLQKQNRAFYGISIIPFFIWMFSEEAQRTTVVKAAEIAHQAIMIESSKTIGVAEASKSVAAVAKSKGIGATVKPLLGMVQTKAVALTMAGVVATGVGAGVVITKNDASNEKAQVETVHSENKNDVKKEVSKDHTHTWEPVYKTVHHKEVKETQTVVDQEAYDEPVYETRTVYKQQVIISDKTTGQVLYQGDSNGVPDSVKSLDPSTVNQGSSFPEKVEEKYQTGTIHHDAVTHQEEVVVQEAYDEQVLKGYKCSECGEEKDS